MKKILLFLGVLFMAQAGQAATEAFCAQQYSFINQNWGVALAQGGDDTSILRAAKKPGSKRFICQCQNYHQKFTAAVIDAKQRAFMTGDLFIQFNGQTKKLKQIVCR